MKTNIFSIMTLLGWIMLGLTISSCSNENENENENKYILNSRVPDFTKGFMSTEPPIEVSDLKGVIRLDYYPDGNQVQCFYIEDAEKKNRCYIGYNTQEEKNFLFDTFTEKDKDWRIISKNLEVKFSGAIYILSDDCIKQSKDWSNVVETGVKLYFIHIKDLDYQILEKEQ